MSDFNQFLNDEPIPITEIGEESFQLQSGQLVEVALLEIKPHRSELESIQQTDPPVDPRILVPWLKGISVKLLVIGIYNDKGERRSMVSSNDVDIDLPLGPAGMVIYEQITDDDINRGFLKIYDDDHRTYKPRWLPDWPNFNATDDNTIKRKRFSFWRTVISGKFGVPRIQEGLAWKGYVKVDTYTAKDGKQKYITHVVKHYKDIKEDRTLEAPWDVREIEISTLRQIDSIRNQEWENIKGSSKKGNIQLDDTGKKIPF